MERREHRRFKVKDGSFAVLRTRPAKFGQMNGECRNTAKLAKLSTKLAKIIDISDNGLAFHYIDSQNRSKELAELDLLFANDAFYLDKISIKRVVDFKIDPEICRGSFVIRRCGVQFSRLKFDQRTGLNYFLKNYTTNEATADPCSFPIDIIRHNISSNVKHHYDLIDRECS